MSNIVKTRAIGEVHREEAKPDYPAVGTWGFVKDDRDSYLMMVTNHGSNHLQLRGGHREVRVHFDTWRDEFTPITADEALLFMRTKADAARTLASGLLRQIQAVTARLGVDERKELTSNGVDVGAIVVSKKGPGALDTYKAALAKAKAKDLPDLFSELRAAHESLAYWLSYEATPLKAQQEQLTALTTRIDRRIFTVQLYAGLDEALTCINPDAAPAENDEPVHLWQARKYIDEEYAARWTADGADIRDVDAFSTWLAEPKNLRAIFPTPRGVCAFKVRRERKALREDDPYFELAKDFYFAQWWDDANETTLLFIRNGDQLWRLEAPIAFPDLLFPSPSDLTVAASKVPIYFEAHYSKYTFITEDERAGRAVDAGKRAVATYIRTRRQWHQFLRQLPAYVQAPKDTAKREKPYFDLFMDEKLIAKHRAGEKLRWATLRPSWHSGAECYGRDARTVFDEAHAHELDRWAPYTPEHLQYDDAQAALAARIQAHNDIVLVLQGLLDRSKALHPHPPWRLFTPEGFAEGLRLHYDTSLALVDDKVPPDFIEYIKENQATLKVGSHAWGSHDAWRARNRRESQGAAARTYRYRAEPSSRGKFGDPGPADRNGIARIVAIKGKMARFEWARERVRRSAYDTKDTVKDSIWVPLDRLFNVETYVPGTLRAFAADPRTRPAYQHWGAMMYAAEMWHAKKNGKDGPNDETLDEPIDD